MVYDFEGRLRPLEEPRIVKVEGDPCDWQQLENEEVVQLFRVRGSGPCENHSDDRELLIRIYKHPRQEPPC